MASLAPETATSAKRTGVLTMIGERYTLILRHEMVDLKTGEIKQIDPPLSICYTMFDPLERGGVVYAVNDMLHKLEHEFLKRMDGGADE